METNAQKVWGSLEGSRAGRNGFATIFIKLQRQQYECLQGGSLPELLSAGTAGPRVRSGGRGGLGEPHASWLFADKATSRRMLQPSPSPLGARATPSPFSCIIDFSNPSSMARD